MTRGLSAFVALLVALLLCVLFPGAPALCAFGVVALCVALDLREERDRS